MIYKEVVLASRLNFTIATLEKIPPPESGRIEFRDSKIPELTLRETASAVKSFSVAKKIDDKYLLLQTKQKAG